MSASPLRASAVLCALLSVSACRTPPKAGTDTAGLSDSPATDDDDDGYAGSDDCDEADPNIHVGAPELCNGVDDNCDGQIDEGVTSTWFTDADRDGFGSAADPIEACEPGDDEVANPDDCDDADPSSYPGAPEICDTRDNDCDGDIDEDGRTIWYADADGDGFGDPTSGVEDCAPASGWVSNGADCDDADSDVFPGATEVCNEVDDDCDNETDEGVTSVFFVDTDSDGWGDPGATTDACSVPGGYAELPGDCDDTNSNIHPDATEICNELDDNCDGDIDDDDASVDLSSATTWYADGDGDGYGDVDTTVSACAEPSGYGLDASDCNDADSAVNPAATEICNTFDDDCDGDIDDDDASVDTSTGLTTWVDADGDGYGDPTSTTEWTCTVPSGRIDDDTDCDDSDSAVNPGATEICNELDDDCDSDIDDEDSSLDLSTAFTWYADTDGDGYGDASTATIACDEPSGYGADDSDCDDSTALSSPDGVELYDGEDNNCDGDVDEDLYKGTGTDGALSVTTTTDLSTDASGSRSVADAVAYSVTAISSATVTLDSTAAGLSTGDEVLLINLQGSDTAYSSVGTFELASVESVSGSSVTLMQTVAELYGESANSDLTDQTIVLQRVPHYTDVSVAAGAVLTSGAWDGNLGGIVAFRSTGTVDIVATGAVVGDELGYAGGETGSSNNCDAFQGESYAGLGEGEGDGFCSAYNETYGHWAANYGGGGAHITGAGGEYAGGATDGDSWTGGSATPPYAGNTYGSVDLATLFYGSGGGGVWNGGTDRGGEDPGPGGDGGGIVLIGADTLITDGSEAITSYGGTTAHWAWGTWTYGAGGGAGGAIWLQVDDLTLATDSIDASGGFGESSHIRVGGDGGEGRVRIDCVTCNGYSNGTTSAETELDDAAEPNPGYSETPS